MGQPIREDMAWLWRRPDPAPEPKTLATELPAKRAVLHQVVRARALHELVQERLPQLAVTKGDGPDAERILDAVLPPRVGDSTHGTYQPRALSADERQHLVQRYQALKAQGTTSRVSMVAMEFRCSKVQVLDEVYGVDREPYRAHKPRRRRPRGVNRWHFTPHYPSAQVIYDDGELSV